MLPIIFILIPSLFHPQSYINLGNFTKISFHHQQISNFKYQHPDCHLLLVQGRDPASYLHLRSDPPNVAGRRSNDMLSSQYWSHPVKGGVKEGMVCGRVWLGLKKIHGKIEICCFFGVGEDSWICLAKMIEKQTSVRRFSLKNTAVVWIVSSLCTKKCWSIYHQLRLRMPLFHAHPSTYKLSSWTFPWPARQPLPAGESNPYRAARGMWLWFLKVGWFKPKSPKDEQGLWWMYPLVN